MYLMYLRKSRADFEAEARGEGETLARHKSILTELAEKQQIEVGAIYEEIVSGDTIASRPQMQKLLQEVSAGMWEGVLVMEIERLARGDTIDQGLVAQAFKYSETKIITPIKTYDPNNEFDETFFEFNLFMSRQEYKTIKRRMQAGRIASAKEGNYLGSSAPLGYKRIRKDGSFTLEIIPDEAEIVKLVFDLYVNQNMGIKAIRTELNKRGITARGSAFREDHISYIIHSPLYKGYVSFGLNKYKKKLDENGKMKTYTVYDPTAIYKGKHTGIISEELFEKAQEIASNRLHYTVKKLPLKNEYTGILFCGLCGHAMCMKQAHSKYYYYMCYHCENKQVMKKYIDEIVYAEIDKRLKQLKKEIKIQPKQNSSETEIQFNFASVNSEFQKLKQQKNKIFELYEREIYDDETFTERMGEIKKRETELNELLKLSSKVEKPIDKSEAIVVTEIFLQSLKDKTTPEELNKLLRKIISRIEYIKTEKGKDFKIDITFKI